MTPDPLFVDDEATLDDVMTLMDARHVAQLPVVCGSTVIGIISRVELLNAVAQTLFSAKRGGLGTTARK